MNTLPAKVVNVDRSGSIASVMLSWEESMLQALILEVPDQLEGIAPGRDMLMLFKEHDLSLSTDAEPKISIVNRIPLRITGFAMSALLARVELRSETQRLTSLITAQSLRLLGLKVGMHCTGLVKPSSIILSDVPA